jgi:hypothetical protein
MLVESGVDRPIADDGRDLSHDLVEACLAHDVLPNFGDASIRKPAPSGNRDRGSRSGFGCKLASRSRMGENG